MSQDPLSRNLYANTKPPKKGFTDYLLYVVLVVVIIAILVAGLYYEWIKLKFFLNNQ